MPTTPPDEHSTPEHQSLNNNPKFRRDFTNAVIAFTYFVCCVFGFRVLAPNLVMFTVLVFAAILTFIRVGRFGDNLLHHRYLAPPQDSV